MLTKYDLRKYKHLKAEMLELQERINELASIMTVPRVPQLTGMPGGSHSEHDKIGNAVAKVDKLRSLYYEKLGELAELQLTIEMAIEKLPADDQMLLRLYYFSCYTWEQVAVRLDINWRSVHRRHAAILERLAQDGAETETKKAAAGI